MKKDFSKLFLKIVRIDRSERSMEANALKKGFNASIIIIHSHRRFLSLFPPVCISHFLIFNIIKSYKLIVFVLFIISFWVSARSLPHCLCLRLNSLFDSRSRLGIEGTEETDLSKGYGRVNITPFLL